ncbi:LysM peptidoglycan-binding domain-containing protein [Enterococcus sp. RIT-PI-f]|uniref:LysM peptidoglycan-binding domain-containing protein n=1 Tax=Enterococcus sp. RIT-PI-f TaxID=1690244 RepID=UPI0006B9C3E0|nr:LysM domain-containing protein [Enterococcus sp. RIT-PI-f]KPG68551.1 LysM domain protein [Enterococcus sp. RIT-PI-f]
MKKFAFTLVAGFGLFAGTSVAFADEQTHVVEPGDTLSSLAATYQTTIDDILSLNDSIEDPNLIFDGETLLIFSDGQPVDRTTTSSSTTEPTETQSQTAEENTAAATNSQTQSSTPGAGSGVLNPVDGINYYNGVRESYYSQKVLPGGGLSIPGRHVASDGTIRDTDGYIVVASDNQAKGSTGQSSLGAYKVYDTGVGHSGIDVYTNW